MHPADRFITLFFRNRHLLILLLVSILLSGFNALQVMPRLEDPRLLNRNPTVTTFFPGASAERVESLVTEIIEQALFEIPEIKTIESTSGDGISVVNVELLDSVTDNQRVFSKIRDRLSGTLADLPPGATRPELEDQFGAVAFTLITGITWSGEGPADFALLNRLAESWAQELRTLSGTELVRVYGKPVEEITVSVTADTLASLGMQPGQLAAVIARADSKRPAGTLYGDRYRFQVEVEGELDSVERIRGLPLLLAADGEQIRLGDVAAVEKSTAHPPTELAFSNGNPTVLIAARVAETERVDLWRQRVEPRRHAFEAQLGGGIRLDIVFDQTGYTRERLLSLGSNLLAGIGVIVLVVFFTMGARAALVVGAALPLTVGVTLFLMASLGIPLHQMSIFGLIVAMGLLIDNAIVMTDEVNHALSLGMTRPEAMVTAVRKLFGPLLASTLTTIFAFAPILLLPGNVGDFIGSIGSTVILSLLTSFAIAMTLTPTLAAIFGTPTSGHATSHWWRNGFRSERGARGLRALLRRGLAKPRRMALIASALPLLGFLLAGQLGSQFFPRTDRNMFGLRIWMPEATALSATLDATRAVEALLREQPELQQVHWMVGRSFPSVYYNLIMDREQAPNFAEAILVSGSNEDVNRLLILLQAELDTRFPEMQILVRTFAQGPPLDAEVAYRVSGLPLDDLKALGRQIRGVMAAHPGLLHTRASLPDGSPKLWFVPDEDEVLQSGYTLEELTGFLQSVLDGQTGGSVLEGREDLPVRVRVEHARMRTPADLADLSLPRPGRPGEWISLHSLGRFEMRLPAAAITRRNGERINLVQAYSRPGALPLDISRDLRPGLEALRADWPATLVIQEAGDSENAGEAMDRKSLFAL